MLVLKIDTASCPEERRFLHLSPIIVCDLNDKPCVRQSYGQCNYYDDWLFEEKQEEVDRIGKEGGRGA